MTLNSPGKHETQDDSKPQVMTLNSPVKQKTQHILYHNRPI